MARRRNDAFYGQDSGTRLSEQAQDEIEHGEEGGAGQKGNNVDFSQRYAASEADEYTEQAEQMTRDLERGPGKYWGMFTDPDKRREYVEGLAELLRGKRARPAQPQEEKEKPFLSRKADDEFWASDEPKKQMPKRL